MAMKTPRRFVLASASPARLRLLRAAGFDPEVIVSGVAEDDVTGDARQVALTLAERKAAAVAVEQPDALVLGCDSVLDLDGALCGKPAGAADAVARWKRMRGNTGTVVSGNCLIDTNTGESAADIAATTVRFGNPSDAEIDAYVASGEPLHVAGAFTLDGLSAPFIDGVDGDPGNVIGVSLPLVRALLAQLGLEIMALWR
jgi:septum formation protein